MQSEIEKPAPTFTGDDMRRLLRRARTCCLSTLSAGDQGPYGSIASLATDIRGHPILLISKLALHTQNLLADGRASVLASELPASGDPLTGPRVTVMGRFAPANNEALKRRYLARHPASSFYAGFGDFSFWRMTPEAIHGVAGFGRISTRAAEEVFPEADEMEELELSAIQHMNEDHAGAVQDYARKLRAEGGPWTIQAIDSDGADLVHEQESVRLEFPQRVKTADELRAMFGTLLRAA